MDDMDKLGSSRKIFRSGQNSEIKKKISSLIFATAIILFVFLIILFMKPDIFDKIISKIEFAIKYFKTDTVYYKNIPIEFGNIEFDKNIADIYNIETKTIPNKKRKRKFALLKKEMDKYPEVLLRKYLKKIFYVSSLKVNGTRWGGTYTLSNKSIYFNSLAAFHGEISSLFYRQNLSKFPKKQWLEINNSEYTSDQFDIVGQAGILKYKEQYLVNGFLTKYGQTNLENDFNQFIRLIYYYPDKVDYLILKYDKIAEKVKLAKKFIRDIE